MDLTLVTCLDLPEPDLDEQPLLAALAEAGVDARVAAWDDPDVDWSRSPLTVVRSTWNYTERRDDFLGWMRRVSAEGTVLRNALSTMLPNTHKGYLAGLERAGVDVVPTRWFAMAPTPQLDPDALRALPWRHVIVKPAIGAGSRGVRAFDLEDDAQLEAAAAHVAALRSSSEVLVQPRLTSIVERGERNLVWIDGEFTHAVDKPARLEGDDEHVRTASTPTDRERLLATSVLRTIPAFEHRELLYARVDMAEDELGTLRVVELELVEPSLFLTLHEPAMERFVASLHRHAVRA